MQLSSIFGAVLLGMGLLAMGLCALGYRKGKQTRDVRRAWRVLLTIIASAAASLIGGTLPLAAKIGPVITVEATALACLLAFALLLGFISGLAAKQGETGRARMFLAGMALITVCDIGGLYLYNRRIANAATQLGLDQTTKYEPEKNKDCPENLKSLYLAFSMYAQDWDGLPPAATWLDNEELTSKVRQNEWLHCPTVSNRHDANFGYAYNDGVAGRKLNLNGKPLNQMPDAAKTPLVYDSTDLAKNAHDAFASLPKPGRHSGRNNILYCDGHVAAEAARP